MPPIAAGLLQVMPALKWPGMLDMLRSASIALGPTSAGAALLACLEHEPAPGQQPGAGGSFPAPAAGQRASLEHVQQLAASTVTELRDCEKLRPQKVADVIAAAAELPTGAGFANDSQSDSPAASLSAAATPTAMSAAAVGADIPHASSGSTSAGQPALFSIGHATQAAAADAGMGLDRQKRPRRAAAAAAEEKTAAQCKEVYMACTLCGCTMHA